MRKSLYDKLVMSIDSIIETFTIDGTEDYVLPTSLALSCRASPSQKWLAKLAAATVSILWLTFNGLTISLNVYSHDYVYRDNKTSSVTLLLYKSHMTGADPLRCRHGDDKCHGSSIDKLCRKCSITGCARISRSSTIFPLSDCSRRFKLVLLSRVRTGHIIVWKWGAIAPHDVPDKIINKI